MRHGVTIVRSMTVIAIVAFDCALMRDFLSSRERLLGLLSLGLAFSVGLVGIVLTPGRKKWVSLAFSMTLVLLYLGFLLGLLFLPDHVDSICFGYLKWVMHHEPVWVIRLDSPPLDYVYGKLTRGSLDAYPLPFRLYEEGCFSLPFLVIAGICGVLYTEICSPRQLALRSKLICYE